jgi:hypothetical protein
MCSMGQAGTAQPRERPVNESRACAMSEIYIRGEQIEGAASSDLQRQKSFANKATIARQHSNAPVQCCEGGEIHGMQALDGQQHQGPHAVDEPLQVHSRGAWPANTKEKVHRLAQATNQGKAKTLTNGNPAWHYGSSKHVYMLTLPPPNITPNLL